MDFDKTQKIQRDEINRILHTFDIKATKLAKMAGLAPSTLNRFLNQDVKHSLSATTMMKISKAATDLVAKTINDPEKFENLEDFESLNSAIRGLQGKLKSTLGAFEEAEKLDERGRDLFVSSDKTILPILGRAVAGKDALFFDNGTIEEYVERPPILKAVLNAYGIYVAGQSMEPRYFRGEIIYVNPNKPPAAGQFVVVQLNDGSALIKQLKKTGTEVIELAQYNPEKTIKIKREDVYSIHLIVGSATA